MTAPVVRAARAEEAPALAALWFRAARAGFGPLLPDDFDWSRFEGGEERIAERIGQDEVRVSVADDLSGYGVFGALRDEGGEGGEVWTLFVDPGTWGTGVAGALMGDGLAWLASRGFELVYVWSFVDNARANRFYRRCGFRPDGTTGALPDFAHLQGARLVRSLDQARGNYTF